MARECDIKMIADVVEKKESIFKAYHNKILSNSTRDPEKVRVFIDDFMSLVGMAKKDMLESAFTKEDIPTDANELIKSMTFGAYTKIEDFVKNAEPEMIDIVNEEIGNRVRLIASSWDDARKVTRDSRFSKQMKHTFEYYSSLTKPFSLDIGPVKIPIGSMMNRINKRIQFMHDRGAVFRNWGPGLDLYRELIGMSHSASAFTKHYRYAVADIVHKHSNDTVTEHMIISMARLLDPSTYLKNDTDISISEVDEKIDSAIRNELSSPQYGISDKAQQDIVINTLKLFQADYNKLNYGFESLWVKNEDGSWRKRTKQEIVDNNETPVMDKEAGYSGPAFVKFMLVTGNRLSKITNNYPGNEKMKVVNEMFSSFDEDKGMRLRNNFMPSSKDNDIFYFANTGTFSRLYSDLNMLHEREGFFSEGYDLISLTNNNAKMMRQFFTSMSEYSVGIALQDKLRTAQSLQANNPLIYDSLKMFADEMVTDYSESKKIPSEALKIWKRFGSAAIGLQASVILTMSAYKNYLGAAGTGMSRMNIFNLADMRKEYNAALNGTGGNSDLAMAIREKYSVYDSFEKISDMIVNEGKQNQKQAVQGLAQMLSAGNIADKLVTWGEKFSDISLNRILGILPSTALTRGFNQSENDLHKIAEWMAYHKANMIINNVKHNVSIYNMDKFYKDDKELTKAVLDGLSDGIFVKTKEMLGDFSKYSKPLWSWKMLRDADTGWKVLMGSLLGASYMFKQVSVVNQDVAKALYSNAMATLKSGSLGMHGTATPAISGQLFIAMYEAILIAMEENESVPKAYGLMGTAPIHDNYKYIKALSSMTKVLNNTVVTEEEANNIINVTKQFVGPLGGGAFRDGGYQKMGDVRGFGEFIDRLTLNMDLPGAFANTIASGMFVDNGENWEFMRNMNKALRSNMPYFGTSNKYLRAVRDLSFITKSIVDGKYQDVERIAIDNIKGNLYGLNIRYPQESKHEDYSSQIFRAIARKNHYYKNYSSNDFFRRSYDNTSRLVDNMPKYYGSNKYLGAKVLKDLKRLNRNAKQIHSR